MGRDTVGAYIEALRSAGLLDGIADALPELTVLHDALERAQPAKPVPSWAKLRLRGLTSNREGVGDNLRPALHWPP